MKKLLCIFFSIIIFVSSFLPVSGQASENKATNTVTADEFVKKISNMMYESENENFQKSETEFLKEKNEFSKFDSCRLIVKSSKKIDTFGAVQTISGYNDLWILKFDSAEKTANAYEYYLSCNEIEYVEVDRTLNALSANEEVVQLTETEKTYITWGPSYVGIDKLNESIISNLDDAEQKVVAVLDTGTDASHPFFNGRVVPTGFNTSTSGERNDSSDDNGHGTQVAGVVIDSTLDNVIVKPYKVLDKYGQGTLITLAAGIICAVNDDVDVINMSIAFSESSEVLKEAVQLADRNDIILVGSAGNDSSTTKYYPASYDCVIKVGAVNESGVIANFSTRADDMDFAAPGVNIYTTNRRSTYKTVSGTSFAAPYVSALAATILSFDPEISSEDLKNVLIDNAISVQDSDANIKYGNGIISAPVFWDSTKPLKKTLTPYFSLNDSVFNCEIDIELFCDTENSVIYYTTDRTVPSRTNPSSIIYDGNSIHISETTVITAVAYCDGLYRSSVVSFGSIIAPVLDENEFEIDSSGVITAYYGSNASFTIPDSINGITVTSIGSNVFSGMNVVEVIMPETVTAINSSAFEGCPVLKTVYGKGIVTIGDRAFYNCTWLKNIFIGQITSIGKEAFYNVCSGHFELTGTTVSLDLSKVSVISESAFRYAAISSLDLGTVSSIANNAFLGCKSLVSVHIDRLTNIANEAFMNCTALNTVEISGLSYISAGAFSGCSLLENVNIPDATYVNARAFENCTSLNEIYLDNAITVYSSAFSGCKSLRIIVVPEMTSFESAVYRAGTTTYPKFSSALQAFIAPKLTRTSAYMFGSAPNILAVSFKTLRSVADNTFSGCNSMMYLNIQSVTNLSELSLAGCKIDFIDARSLQTASGLPNNSGIMLSNNFTQATVNATSLTVYGTMGSSAENFAQNSGYNFRPIPCLYQELPEYITEISGTVTVYAVGFDLEYQWYSNIVDSNEGGTPIIGATSETYTFTEEDTAYYYYCVVTQNDYGVITQHVTDTIIKDPVPANYGSYNLAVNAAKSLNPLHYTNFEIVEEALSVDVSGKRSCEQKIVDKQAAEIRSATARLNHRKVSSIQLTAERKSLSVLQSTKVKIKSSPQNAVYKSVEWSSDNTDAFVVSKSGRVRCVGSGTAYIVAKVTNYDGSVIFARIKFKSSAKSLIEVFFEFFIKYFSIALSNYSMVLNIK